MPGKLKAKLTTANLLTEPPAGQFLVTSDNTTQYAQLLLQDAADVFVNQSLFSIGGNDINIKCYDDDKTTQTDLLVNDWSIQDAIGNFTGAMYKTLAAANKTTVVWDGKLTSSLFASTAYRSSRLSCRCDFGIQQHESR